MPHIDFDKKHGYYHYGLPFFNHLCNNNDHENIFLSVENIKKRSERNLVVSVSRKLKDSPFMSREDFNKIPGIEKVGGAAK